MEIRWEGTLTEKFLALITTQKKNKHNVFESVGLSWALAIGKHYTNKGKSNSASRSKGMTKANCPKARKRRRVSCCGSLGFPGKFLC